MRFAPPPERRLALLCVRGARDRRGVLGIGAMLVCCSAVWVCVYAVAVGEVPCADAVDVAAR